MSADFTRYLTAQSIVGELPSHSMTLALSERGRVLGEAFDRDSDLPGVVMTDDSGVVRGVISRGQYLRLVGRHLGHEVYDPRPLQLMFEALDPSEVPLAMNFDTPIQEAVSRALGRARHLIYEPVIVRGDDGSLRIVDFPDLLRADARISALRNVQMRQILETVQEGFLLVDRDQRIATEYSASLETLLGTPDLAGRGFGSVLAEILSVEQAELARDYLATLFDPNVIERLVRSINPLMKVEARIGGATRHLAFRFVRSNEDGAIRRLLVRVEDITREVELAAEIEAQEQRTQERVDLVFDIVKVDPGSLGDFLGRFRREIDAGARSLARNGDGPAAEVRLQGLARSLHTLKGEAGMLGLSIYQRRLHRAEDRVASLHRSGVAVEDLPRLQPELAGLDQLAREALELIERFRRLGGVRATGVVSAPSTTASDATPAPSTPVAPTSTPATLSQAPTTVERPAKPAIPARAPSLFEGLARLVEELAHKLGKSARFVSHSEEGEIPAPYRELARDALVQLTRNSLVHGLEGPEERRRLGKPVLGTLQFAVRRQPGRLELVFQDDGAGLDFEAIAHRASERGFVLRDGVSSRELAHLIFEPGFSTARDTTVDAGRGVGLDLVKARVVELGGSIVPHSRRGELCAFQILLPEPRDPS